MLNPDFGIRQFLVSLIEGAFSLGLPVAGLLILYKFYVKLKSIEKYLKQN